MSTGINKKNSLKNLKELLFWNKNKIKNKKIHVLIPKKNTLITFLKKSIKLTN